MRRALAASAAFVLVLMAAPASAENPVLDAEGDADVAASLAEATEVQGVCYGYELVVDDQDSFTFSGTFASSSLGAGMRATSADPRCDEVVELVASMTYVSSFSESEDFAQWQLASTLPELTIDDLEDLGFSAGDLTNDGKSERTLLGAVLALPRLATEQAGKAPVVLEPNTAALPSDAVPTNSPGSDWLRENGVLLAVCVLLILAGIVLLVTSRRAPSAPAPSYRPL